jgi:hypothetical protein
MRPTAFVSEINQKQTAKSKFSSALELDFSFTDTEKGTD